MQALIMQHPWPTDPGIARGTLERCRLPAEQGKPAFIGYGDVAQRLAEEGTQAEIMMFIDQGIPPLPFLGANRADAHAAEQLGLRALGAGDIAIHGRLFTPLAAKCPVPDGTEINSTGWR